MIHDHDDGVMVIYDLKNQPMVVNCKDYGLRDISDVWNRFTPYLSSNGILEYHFDNSSTCTYLVTIDVEEDITYGQEKYTIITHKYTGEGWDNENEDFNRVQVKSMRTSGTCAALGTFKNFNDSYNSVNSDIPCYQIDLRTMSLLVFTGKENSGVTPYLTILALKDGKITKIFHRRASILLMDENEDMATMFLGRAKDCKSKYDDDRDFSQLIFDKKENIVKITENLEFEDIYTYIDNNIVIE